MMVCHDPIQGQGQVHKTFDTRPSKLEILPFSKYLLKVKVKVHIALYGLETHHGASPAIWDHTLLPATRHR